VPEGPSKQRFVVTCNGCHDINRVRVGYTPEGWLTVVRMMQNVNAPVPAEEWGAMTDYLIKNFPERKRPPAVIVDGPAKVNIEMWDVPTQGSRPHDPLAAHDGSIWWSGQLVNKLGRVDPKTGVIREYTLKSAFTGPHGIAEDKAGNVWFTGNNTALIGKLDPNTGLVTEYPMPDANAKDPHTLNFDQNGILWFTVQQANMLGRLDPATGAVKLVTLADAEVAPVWADDKCPRHSGVCRIRCQQDRDHRSEDDGDQGVHAAESGRPAAAPCDRSRWRDLVRRLFARVSRQA